MHPPKETYGKRRDFGLVGVVCHGNDTDVSQIIEKPLGSNSCMSGPAAVGLRAWAVREVRTKGSERRLILALTSVATSLCPYPQVRGYMQQPLDNPIRIARLAKAVGKTIEILGRGRRTKALKHAGRFEVGCEHDVLLRYADNPQ